MASKGVNKVILVGNLGKDPEVRYTQDGKAIASLTLATSESWKDQSGQVQEKTEWHRVSIFGKLAEIAGEYLPKGSQILHGQCPCLLDKFHVCAFLGSLINIHSLGLEYYGFLDQHEF